MGTAPLDAAFAFASHGDWDRVVPAARQALSSDPQDSSAHALLALGLAHMEQAAEAVTIGRRAVALDPESPFTHYALGCALLEHDDVRGAERSAREALRLEPDGSAHALLGQVLARQRRWQDVLDTAGQGLQIEPAHAGCANLRAMALGNLGRVAEAETAVRGVLTLDPDNAHAHANRGWMLLRQSNVEEALESFRTALRMDPSLEWARAGIIEALKARKGVYRLFLQYALWMGTLTSRQRWMVVFGLYVGGRMARTALKHNPELMPVLGPLVALYALFVVASWIADPLSNLLLRLNPFGRLALRAHEIRASNLIGGCLAAFAVAALLGAVTGAIAWFVIATGALLMLIPIGGAYQGYGSRAWQPLSIGAVVMGACAAVAGLLAFVNLDMALLALIPFVVGVVVYPWAANYLIMKYE